MGSTSPLSRDECCKVVKRHLRRDDFELAWFVVAPLSTDLKGFMGDYLKLRVSVSVGGKDSQGARTTELQFFVKTVPQDDGYRKSFATATTAYQKEVLFYGELRQAVQKHLRCPDYESCTYLATVPHCYYLRPDMLVLEDLALSGFRMLDPSKPLDIRHCECVLKALARLHAASLVWEEREGQRLVDKYPLLTQESLYCNEPGAQLYLAQVTTRRDTHELLDLVPRFAPGTPHNQELHSLLDSAMESVYVVLKPSEKYRNVLCHRDLWVNNMLFGEDAKGELSVRLVDFQTLHLEPPARDVVTFLHLTTTRDVRNAHYQTLLELYHQTLADVLRQHDLDVDSILPLKDFLQSCEETKPVATVIAIYILEVTMLPLQQDLDLEGFVLERGHLVKAAFQQDERYRSRMIEAMEEMVETCLMPRLRKQEPVITQKFCALMNNSHYVNNG